MLIISHLTAGYGNKQVLNDISLTVNTGDIVLLTGGNGSGKSTFLKAIYGIVPLWPYDDKNRGHIIFEGRDFTNLPVSVRLRSGMAYMPQKQNVFDNFTVEENLLTSAGIYPSADAHRKVDSIVARFPKLSASWHRTPFTMSGGERQLLAFCCAAIHTPRLMLLDEPFAGVDDGNCLLMAEEIVYLQSLGVTFVIVEHKINLLASVPHMEIRLKLGSILK